jgi:Zn-dependent M32 family carboxypeptidase
MAAHATSKGFQGLDYDQIIAFAQRIDDGKKQVEGVYNGVLTLHEQLTWIGPDRDKFFDDLSKWLPQIRHAIRVIDDNTHELRRRATTQLTASL